MKAKFYIFCAAIVLFGASCTAVPSNGLNSLPSGDASQPVQGGASATENSVPPADQEETKNPGQEAANLASTPDQKADPLGYCGANIDYVAKCGDYVHLISNSISDSMVYKNMKDGSTYTCFMPQIGHDEKCTELDKSCETAVKCPKSPDTLKAYCDKDIGTVVDCGNYVQLISKNPTGAMTFQDMRWKTTTICPMSGSLMNEQCRNIVSACTSLRIACK